jgi:hypothetical protein
LQPGYLISRGKARKSGQNGSRNHRNMIKYSTDQAVCRFCVFRNQPSRRKSDDKNI